MPPGLAENLSPPGGKPASRTPVAILTGFLGSGKTTVLNAALRSPSLARAAVLINEFGEVPLDHALTVTSDDNIVVLENGCLCCTVFGDLIQTLDRLYHLRAHDEIPRFDRVLIETSGLADPTSVLQAFLSDPTLAHRYRVTAVITIVDAINASATLDAHEEAVRQVAVADDILITKLDLLPREEEVRQLGELAGRLRQLNPAAVIRLMQDVDATDLLTSEVPGRGHFAADLSRWLKLDAYDDGGSGHAGGCETEHLHHPHDQAIATFSLIRDEPTSYEALELLMSAIEKNLGPNLLRVKGVVNVAERPGRPAVIQGAQHLLHNAAWLDSWPDDDQRTRIVFITKDMPAGDLEEMITLLDRVASRTAAARASAKTPD